MLMMFVKKTCHHNARRFCPTPSLFESMDCAADRTKHIVWSHGVFPEYRIRNFPGFLRWMVRKEVARFCMAITQCAYISVCFYYPLQY